MSKEKIEWAIYTNKEDAKQKEVYYKDLDKELYEAKYKNNLTCINGCKARVKFTHRKNKVKFFSTWNGEGNKHEEGCPFNVKYKGKVGRKELRGFYEKREVNDEDIRKSLLNKINGLKRKYNGEEQNKVQSNTKNVKNLGKKNVPVDGEEGIEKGASKGQRRKHNIMSIDAKYLTTAYIDTSKCVYGIADNAQIGNENGNTFGYINLINNGYTVSVYFPEAFYSQEDGITLVDFQRLFRILDLEVNKNKEKNYVIVCYGKIGRKKRKGININIINEKHIFINDMSIREILYEGKIKDINYDIV